MFAVHEVTLGIQPTVAAARLVSLATGDGLEKASEAAYEGGLAVLRVGPLGGVRGLSKLVRVKILEPVERGGTLTVPLRWEVTGAAGDLFPVLDADLILARNGGDQALLALAGSYRPPLGKAGTVLDRAIMHRVATATIRSLVHSLAEAIARSAPQVSPCAEPARLGTPRTRPGGSLTTGVSGGTAAVPIVEGLITAAGRLA